MHSDEGPRDLFEHFVSLAHLCIFFFHSPSIIGSRIRTVDYPFHTLALLETKHFFYRRPREYGKWSVMSLAHLPSVFHSFLPAKKRMKKTPIDKTFFIP